MSDFADELQRQAVRDRDSFIVGRELERRSKDKVLAINPTDEDFVDTYDGFEFVYPNKDKDIGFGKGKKIVERYLFEHYSRHMTNKLIQQQIDEAVEKELDKRSKAGQDVVDVWNKNQIINSVVGSMGGGLSNMNMRKEIMRALYGGVVEKFGAGVKSEGTARKQKDTGTYMSNEFDFMLEMDMEDGFKPEVVSAKKEVEQEEIDGLKDDALSRVAK